MTTAAAVSHHRPRDALAPGPKSRLAVDQGWKWLAMHDGLFQVNFGVVNTVYIFLWVVS